MTSPVQLARIAGAFYLVVALFSAFAIIFVDGRIYVPGDAGSTAESILANAAFVRLAVLADLVQATASVLVGMTLYLLLKRVDRSAAAAMVIFIAIAAGIMCLDAVFRFGALRVATDATYVAAFGAKGANALILLLLDLQHYGFLIAQVFFGLWLLPMGYLAYRSGWFPKALGILLVVGGAAYLVDLLLTFLLPEIGQSIHGVIVIPPAIAEIWMVAYLLVLGVNPSGTGSRDLAAA
jgi:hypothetical protein